MSGRIIFRPEAKHACAPGWTYTPAGPGHPLGLPQGTMMAHPPTGSSYPVGCRWQCDCGKVWVRRRPPRQNPHGGQWIVGGRVVFTPEHWWERWLRERRENR